MASAKATYFSFLLRMWRSEGESEAEWRASLENAQTGTQERFASLDELVERLREITSGAPDEDQT